MIAASSQPITPTLARGSRWHSSRPTVCPGPEAFGTDPAEVRLSRKELLEAAELDEAALGQLEQYGLVATRPGSNHYDGTSLVVARTVAEMSRFGIEPRHLRSFKAAADREVGLVEQVVTPLVRQRNPEAKARAEEVARELAALSVRLHAALVKAGLRPGPQQVAPAIRQIGSSRIADPDDLPGC